MPIAFVGAWAMRVRETPHGLLEDVGFRDLRRQAETHHVVGRYGVAGQNDPGGGRQADEPGEQEGPTTANGNGAPGPNVPEYGVAADDAKVRRQGQIPGDAVAISVDRGDGRFVQPEPAAHEPLLHEANRMLSWWQAGRHLAHATQVISRRKRRPGAREDDGADGRIPGRIVEVPEQRPDDGVVDGVQFLRVDSASGT